MKRKTLEERYQDNFRKQGKILDEFIKYETEWACDLITWYKCKKLDMPFDEYRTCAFFINKEYLNKQGSLVLLYEMFVRCNKELPEADKENAFDLLRFKFIMYYEALKKGGYL